MTFPETRSANQALQVIEPMLARDVLRPATLLVMLREALDSPLVARGADVGLRLLGPAADFWRQVDFPELKRMAAGGNAAAQAEWAWRAIAGINGQASAYGEAFRWASRSAEKACAAGEAALGWLLYHGYGVPRDWPEAARLLRSAAEQGDFRAYDPWARCLFFGRGVAADQALAVRWWQDAAGAGVAAAMFSLGLCLQAGAGCGKDAAQAVAWFQRAAEQGLADGMLQLARCYRLGAGTSADAALAAQWLERAAEAGQRDAAYELGQAYANGKFGLSVNPAEALRWWRAAGRRGQAAACLRMAHCYRWGEMVRLDKAIAFAWYRRAAASDARDHVWLGECCEQGEGVSPDAAQAVAHFRLAAEAGDLRAKAEWGRCLLRGIGGEMSVVKGEALLRAAADAGWPGALTELQRHWFAEGERQRRRWQRQLPGEPAKALHSYRKAAELGHRQAALRLAECLQQGWCGEADEVQAINWYRKAAALPEAKVALGDAYYFGRGVIRNGREAMRWYEHAAIEHGHAYAMYRLGYGHYHGDGVARNVRQGLQWLRRAAHQGHAEASAELARCESQLAGAHRSPIPGRIRPESLRPGHVQPRHEFAGGELAAA